MDVKTALEYTKMSSRSVSGLFERVSRVLAKELTRINQAVEMSPIQQMTLPNGTTVTVALVLVDENGKVK